MTLETSDIWLIILAGITSSFINTIAGGGSFLSLPLLIFLGVPASLANGTNRISIVLQSLLSAYLFYKKGKLDIKKCLYLSIPAVCAALLGAYLARFVANRDFELIIAGFMLLMLVFIFIGPKEWQNSRPERQQNGLSLLEFIIFFAIGLYGGFLQAGVGIAMMIALVLIFGFNSAQANAMKMGLSLLINLFALLVFQDGGLVNWEVGIYLSAGGLCGAWLGTTVSLKIHGKYLRWGLIIIIFILSLRLLIQ